MQTWRKLEVRGRLLHCHQSGRRAITSPPRFGSVGLVVHACTHSFAELLAFCFVVALTESSPHLFTAISSHTTLRTYAKWYYHVLI